MKILVSNFFIISLLLGSLTTSAWAVNTNTTEEDKDKVEKEEEKEDISEAPLNFNKLESQTKNPEFSKDSLHQADADARIKKADHEIVLQNIDQVKDLEKCQPLTREAKLKCRSEVVKKAE